MEILLLTHYYAPENSAPQRRWSALVERFVAAGHRVTVVCPPPHYPKGRLAPEHRFDFGVGREQVDDSGARVFRVSYLPHDGRIHTRTLDHLWTASATVRRVRQLVRSREIAPDVIVATAPALPSLVAGRAIARRFKLPLVAEMRDAWPDLVSHTPGLASERGLMGTLKRLVHQRVTELQKRASHVVTTTESFARVLADRGVRHVSVIRNGTSSARYAAVPARVADHKELRALYMGNIGRSQGLEVALEAAAALRANGVPIELRIVGHGAALGRLRSLNIRLGSPAHILGAVAGPAVLEHYAWADTCIVSLRDWTPFAWTVPSKLYELLAAGRHMTAIVDGESADIVREARSGDVVRPGDSMALVDLWRALQESPQRLAVGSSGREWVARNADYDALAQRYIEILRAVA